MADTIQGGCSCGAARFEIELPTLFFSHCHCSFCRRAHAAAFVSWTAVPAERFRWLCRDTLVGYRSSDPVTRSFCERCGTQLHYVSKVLPGKVYMPVAVLDSPMDRDPESHVNFVEAVSYVTLGDDLPRHDGFD